MQISSHWAVLWGWVRLKVHFIIWYQSHFEPILASVCWAYQVTRYRAVIEPPIICYWIRLKVHFIIVNITTNFFISKICFYLMIFFSLYFGGDQQYLLCTNIRSDKSPFLSNLYSNSKLIYQIFEGCLCILTNFFLHLIIFKIS